MFRTPLPHAERDPLPATETAQMLASPDEQTFADHSLVILYGRSPTAAQPGEPCNGDAILSR